jgi:hypothetical protein
MWSWGACLCEQWSDMRSRITSWERLGMNRIVIAACLHLAKPGPHTKKKFIRIKCLCKPLHRSLRGEWTPGTVPPESSFWSAFRRLRSRDGAVCIATGYGLDDRGVGVRVPVESRILFSPRRPDRLWGPAQPPPIQWVPEALSPGVKRSGREADYSPPASADFKKMWIYISTPPHAFMAWC